MKQKLVRTMLPLHMMGKNYPFTVEVKDTTSPQCKAKDYIYMQPGTLIVDDLVTEIKVHRKLPVGSFLVRGRMI